MPESEPKETPDFIMVIVPDHGPAIIQHYKSLEDFASAVGPYIRAKERKEYKGQILGFYGHQMAVTELAPTFKLGVPTLSEYTIKMLPAAEA